MVRAAACVGALSARHTYYPDSCAAAYAEAV